MTLIKHKRPVMRRNRTFPSMFDEFFGDMATGMKDFASHVPSVNIKEEDERFVLEMSAAGYKKDEVKLTVEDDVLTIAGEHQVENEDKGEKYITREFSKGSFKRSFNLNGMVNADNVKANFDNGILSVEMPKVEAAVKKMREINIG